METLISQKVLNALQENRSKFSESQLNEIVGDLNSDSGIIRADLFLIGIELGKLYQLELLQETEIGLTDEINKAIENIENFFDALGYIDRKNK
jgi:hypothetical protein